MIVRLSLVFVLFFASQKSTAQSYIQAGKIDLTSVDFLKDKTLKMNGQWKFASNQFVNPREIEKINNYHEVPGLWKTPIGYATYALKVILPKNRPYLALQVPDIYSSYQLTINGHYADIKGYAADNIDDAIPYRLVKIIPIPEEYDSVDIVIHVSNYRHHKAGIGKPIIIGSQVYLEHRAFLSRTFDAFIGGCLMVSFFFFLGLYFYGRHDKTSLFFALFCFTYSLRVCFSGNHMINQMIPTFPWNIQIRVEYATMYLATIFFGYFVYYLFPKTLTKAFINAYTIVAFIFVPLAIFTPPYFFTQVNIVHLVFMLVGIGVVAFLFIKSVFNKEKGSAYSLLSIIGFLIVLITKTLDYFNIFDEILFVTFVGQILFFLTHALVLSNHYSNSWRQAQKNAEQSARAKTNFLSVMSHEIRTPLNSVIGTTLHLLDNSPREDQSQDLKNLKVSSENLLGIINNILDFNKIDSGHIEIEQTNINLPEFINDLANQTRKLAEDKGLELIVNLDKNLSGVRVDSTRLTQILGNLINNAVKFTNEGNVLVEVNHIETIRNKQTIQFNVIDSGIGIREEDIDLIFAPFKQVSSSDSRNYSGTGLGLTITKKLIELMGSNLTMESRPGKGSRFYFSLILDEVPESTLQTKEDKVMDLKQAMILLVDDHDLNVLMTKNFLLKWNAKVTTAVNGLEAIDKVNKESFDAILMDIQMPEMDGFEASQIIRSQGFTKPIIAVTADSYQESITFEKYGMNARINKPFDPKVLFKTIDSLMEV